VWNAGKSLPPNSGEVNRQTAVELGRIGVNLNQLIRVMNTAVASGQDIPNIKESLAVVEKVSEPNILTFNTYVRKFPNRFRVNRVCASLIL
jgi:hypothetical protein